jgi:hypothetical protein
MKPSTDLSHKEGPHDRLFDEIVQMIIEAPRDWRGLQVRRPGDEERWPKAANRDDLDRSAA